MNIENTGERAIYFCVLVENLADFIIMGYTESNLYRSYRSMSLILLLPIKGTTKIYSCSDLIKHLLFL